MSDTVYASAGGRRYHNERFCQAAYNARALWKFDPMQWVPGMPLVMLTDGRDIRETTVLDALGAGKTPCHACIPGSDAALAVSSCEEDHGHEPMDVYWNGKLHTVLCYRCRIPWPCTTAVILGLVPREVTA